ncbi:unnamed protein product [Cuscuta epithymum]|uniref:sucrose-phosphate synthase n=1 Tax=Cuscuta epithymum TaxID=186058 RepID=A0AAV0E6U1_9ASTE|nr:unnamed protein product [Cuscuta epithymum]
MSRALAAEQGNEGKPVWPYVIHGHYADAGEVAARISGTLNVPMVFTGHSLGRNKFEQLLKQGMLTEDINATYKIIRRIEAEELALDSAEMVVTSTRQEIEEQWGLYDGFDVQLERKLRIRRQRGVSCLGRYMPRMVVIHPGMDFSSVKSQDLVDGEADLKGFSGTGKIQKKPIPHIWAEVCHYVVQSVQILKFFTNPHKPMILALSRPDPKKNVMTLLKAFGECRALQELANMTLILGNRDDIEEMSSNTSTVVTAVLKLIDRYNLYGQVAYPKHHKQHEVPDIYRLAAKTKAAAYGLPVVATKNGGPVDIIKELNNGLLVDPHDQQGISDALLKLVVDKALWLECRKNGLKNISRFSWPDHCLNYLSHVEHCRKRHPANFFEVIVPATEEPMTESLCGVEDFSLKFSIDADLKLNRDVDMDNRKQELINVLTRKQSLNPKLSISYFPGRRQALYVVAVDCYDNMGNASEILSLIINNVNQIRGSKSSQTGLVLMTGMSLHEMKEAIKNSQANLEDFDAIACNSGSEMYYPWRDMVLDEDYEMHIEYRWPCENVKSVMTRLAKVDASGTDSDDMTCISPSSSRCYTYIIKAGTKTRRVNDLRQRLRMRGFRCNTVYTHAGLRLNVIPLYASRSQAIRYLSIRWGIDLSRITVFVGESGDTDYADLLMGLHKIIILQDCVECGSHKLLHDEDSIKWKDVTSQNNTTIAESYEAQVICTSLEKLGSM